MSKRLRSSPASQPLLMSKRVRAPAPELQCIFPMPAWLIEAGGKGRVAFMTYGRYQPAHIGHRIVFDKLVRFSREDKHQHDPMATWADEAGRPASNVFVFASPTVNKRAVPASDLLSPVKSRVQAASNPLHPNQKVALLEKQTAGFQNPAINIINMAAPEHEVNSRRDMSAAVKLLLSCYESVKVMVGSDRMKSFGWLTVDGRVELISAGQRDPDAVGPASVSSTMVRNMALAGKDLTPYLTSDLVTAADVSDMGERLREAYLPRGGARTRRARKRRTRRTQHRRKATRRRRTIASKKTNARFSHKRSDGY